MLTRDYIDEALRMNGREPTDENRAEVLARFNAWVNEVQEHPERYVTAGYSVPKYEVRGPVYERQPLPEGKRIRWYHRLWWRVKRWLP